MSQFLWNFYVITCNIIFYCIGIYLKRGNLSNNKTVWLQSVDAVWGKVAGKSRRIWRSGLTSSTEDESADLPRDCPQCAAAGCIFTKNETIPNNNSQVCKWNLHLSFFIFTLVLSAWRRKRDFLVGCPALLDLTVCDAHARRAPPRRQVPSLSPFFCLFFRPAPVQTKNVLVMIDSAGRS